MNHYLIINDMAQQLQNMVDLTTAQMLKRIKLELKEQEKQRKKPDPQDGPKKKKTSRNGRRLNKGERTAGMIGNSKVPAIAITSRWGSVGIADFLIPSFCMFRNGQAFKPVAKGIDFSALEPKYRLAFSLDDDYGVARCYIVDHEELFKSLVAPQFDTVDLMAFTPITGLWIVVVLKSGLSVCLPVHISVLMTYYEKDKDFSKANMFPSSRALVKGMDGRTLYQSLTADVHMPNFDKSRGVTFIDWIDDPLDLVLRVIAYHDVDDIGLTNLARQLIEDAGDPKGLARLVLQVRDPELVTAGKRGPKGVVPSSDDSDQTDVNDD